ncbi:hypothetical protein PR048_005404 [Dryococelus australis]|uniref:Uncharacterized protein n=1 Tax=Dryococelus australis TaxID=614101 RepID=A0ABQ9IA98_9NEOP|nr:hypothetical protein PR048_005404 [Dryococelus australis]
MTHAILERAKYCMTELNFSYFLRGKIQTDPLEGRFRKYRIITYRLHKSECEAKLRLQDSLPLVLNSRKYGLIEIMLYENSDACKEKSTVKLSKIVHSITVGEKHLRDLESVIPVLTYLARYCVYKLLKKLIRTGLWWFAISTPGCCEHCNVRLCVLVMITTAQLKEELSNLDVCDAGHTLETIIQHIVSMSSNALLRNYCLKKNDI